MDTAMLKTIMKPFCSQGLHAWGKSLITGFTHSGYAIGRCKFCGCPMVNYEIKCTKYVIKTLSGVYESKIKELGG